MKSAYKYIIAIVVIIIGIILILKDILWYGTISISTIWTILIIVLFTSLIILSEKRSKVICISIISALFLITILFGMFTYRTFGTEQSIAAIQGYYKIVHQKEPYYVIPVESLSWLYKSTGDSFICKKIKDTAELSYIIEDYYPRKKIKEMKKEKKFDNVQLYKKTINNDKSYYLYVYENDNFSWFKTGF